MGVVPLLALAAATFVALAIGHAFGGPHPDDRTALAVSCATRHVGIALLAASTAPPRVAVLVLAYVLRLGRRLDPLPALADECAKGADRHQAS